MKAFDRYMNDYQIQWRRNYLENQVEGTQNRKKHPWILPRKLWEEGLVARIRSGKNSLPAYLDDTGVQKHNGVHNLKSSPLAHTQLYPALPLLNIAVLYL